MNKLLVVVDMQNDFIDGSLGTPEAQAIVPKVVEKIKNWDGDILLTKDTHGDNYLQTTEGENLPIKHCIKGTDGHNLNTEIKNAISSKSCHYGIIEKDTFGSETLLETIGLWNEFFYAYEIDGFEYIELIGLCTDICVVTNALLIKTRFPYMKITVDASCCAGVTSEKHLAALEVMRSCQIEVKE